MSAGKKVLGGIYTHTNRLNLIAYSPNSPPQGRRLGYPEGELRGYNRHSGATLDSSVKVLVAPDPS